MPTLSIAIPTYNRADKLPRLLKTLENLIALSDFGNQIEILVSDNASIDDTYSLMMSLVSTNGKIKYFRQPENIGFDANCEFLYEQAQSDYVWFFADDDIPLNNSLSVIFKGLQEYNPDAFIFSFEQPLGSKIRTFNFPEDYRIITRPPEIINFLSKFPKISIYILRKIILNPQQLKELEPFYNNCFFFVDLAFTVIAAAKKPILCIVSQQLAQCDNDYVKFEWKPRIFLEFYKIFYHPFVMSWLPNLAKSKIDESYCVMVQYLCAVKLGRYIVSDIEYYNKEIRNVRIRLSVLIRKPRLLILLIIARLNLIRLYRMYSKIFRRGGFPKKIA